MSIIYKINIYFREIIGSGRICLLDCSPGALKILHNSNEFMPYVVFLAAPGKILAILSYI